MIAMNQLALPDPNRDRSNISVVWFAAIFAVVTYAAVSTRAVLSPFEVNYFIDAKRLFSVVIGACILWLAIRAAERRSDQSPGAQIVAVLNIAIPGAIGLLIAREGYDLAMSGEFAQRAALNLRWMLTWIGYFTAAVATFLALSYYRQLQGVAATTTENNVEEYSHGPLGPDIVPGHWNLEGSGYELADFDFDPRTTR